jgi:Geranylgeranyl pyrophosphate synthase
MIFNELLEKRQKNVEEIVYKYLPKEEGMQKTVIEAMNYSIAVGGKRIRPILMQASYVLFGGKEEIIEPFMAAIEMLHNYSLVHDDLPAMDDDEYRRGCKTTHVVYGEAMGILAGDGLLNYAFETAIKAFDFGVGSAKVGEALKVLAHKAGIYGMIGGQTVDIESVDQMITAEKLDFIFRLKTAALIEASMMIGAILAGASKEQVNLIEEIARNVGIAFQIQDDILDVISTLEVLGKPIRSDEKNNKVTYVTLKGLEQAKQDVENMSNQALESLTSLALESEFLYNLIVYLIKREK